MIVYFFLSDYKIGLTHLLLEQGIQLKQLNRIDFCFISGEAEQTSGLKEKALANGLLIDYINGLDIHKDFMNLTKEFRRLVIIKPPEFVHVQNNWQLALVAFVKLIYFKKYKIIYTIHSYRHNFPIRSYIIRIILSLALLLLTWKVVVASSFMKRKFILVKYKISTIFFGVDDSFFKIDTPPQTYKGNNIVFAGQFRKGKNQELLIRSVKRINDLAVTNYKLYLAGDGPNLESCKKLAYDLGLDNQIIFTGNLDRNGVLSLYKKCQIAIVATNVETFGHCIAEPYALGLCTISRRTGIAEDIITHGINGFLFEKDEELLSLLSTIVGNESLISRIGQTAFDKRNSLRWSSNIQKYMNLYS
jgi:glycosyltransferase involved in cell wall biosynthesis